MGEAECAYLESLSAYHRDEDCVVTFGKFDGLHLGHQKLIKRARELAQAEHLTCVLCAFDMGGNDQLMTNQERREQLAGRVDVLVNCPFTKAFRETPAMTFIRDVIGKRFHARYVVVGTDFRFGYRQGGDARLLKEQGASFGYQAVVLPKERYEGQVISSTYIKRMMEEGKISDANQMLGYAFSVTGTVEHGRHLGSTLGFPTVNVPWPAQKIQPRRGVYVTRTKLDGVWYPGISNIGVKPTVSTGDSILIESCLFGYSGDAYGQNVTTRLMDFIRPEQKFENVTELKTQVAHDIQQGKQYFGIEV